MLLVNGHFSSHFSRKMLLVNGHFFRLECPFPQSFCQGNAFGTSTFAKLFSWEILLTIYRGGWCRRVGRRAGHHRALDVHLHCFHHGPHSEIIDFTKVFKGFLHCFPVPQSKSTVDFPVPSSSSSVRLLLTPHRKRFRGGEGEKPCPTLESAGLPRNPKNMKSGIPSLATRLRIDRP